MSTEVVRNYSADQMAKLAPAGEISVEQLVNQRFVGISHWATHARVAVAVHASHQDPVLLEGEPGTGKKFLARLIHDCSPRRNGPFICVTCWPVIEPSLETLLFGVFNSSNAGQLTLQKGLVDMAAGGTLYLDLCSSFSAHLKSKIIRLIQHQEYSRLRSDLLERSNVRVLLGSTLQPEANTKNEKSSDPLLASAKDKLVLPPLRERKTDIETLSQHFIRECCLQQEKEERVLSREALHLLRQHDWPGNIEELKRCLEFAVQQVSPPRIDANSLPAHIVNSSGFNGYSLPASGIDWEEEIKRFEISVMRAALKQSLGVQRKAAELLGLNVTTFHSMIKRHGIDVNAFRSLDENY